MQSLPNCRLVVALATDYPTPRDARESFADALRLAVRRALLAGRIDPALAEELHRTIPAPGRA